MKILITGIGCIGKSSLRERLVSEFPDNVITVDMDYTNKIPSDKDKVVIVESVHGLEENPHSYDKILYLLPPRWHLFFWLRRAWAWFSTGVVDLSCPRGKIKKYALSNIPLILEILIRNILLCNKWVHNDLIFLQINFVNCSHISSSIEDGYVMLFSWINNKVVSCINMNISE